MDRVVLLGRPTNLGATWDGTGVNFALYSENAQKVELCLFDNRSKRERERITLRERTAFVWHCYLPGVQPGQQYGYRVYGPFDTSRGLRFNPAKLLVDPYARAISGRVDWSKPIFPYRLGSEGADLTIDRRDSGPGMPKCIVVNPYFDWSNDNRPDIPLCDSVIYELHVKGFSILNEKVPPRLRGTYAGLGSPASIAYLKRLGITAVELMPVHQFVHDKQLVEKGLKNYWGYNTLNYFSPDAGYSASGDAGGQVGEFKAMVRALHREGIEVILDVVYNHTAEGNHLGPMLSFRGIDNPTYYRLTPDQRYYMDYTGTGNSLNVRHPQVLKLIMDSLRYWVTEMHVDGFRFDLASTLARELHDVDRLSAFFDIIHQDPVISKVKLIAEPWDVGDGGYQVGNFPVLWAEWNGKYRDTIRRYWKGAGGELSNVGFRLSGSSDLYQLDGRRPSASINFITAHDGFTLHDLVSYNEKHNEANGENNQDGCNDNDSWNMGEEGPTSNIEIIEARERQKRNLLATLLLSQGVPMISGGDELGRTQRGNNNAYCQDNEISWFDWQLDERRKSLLDFTASLIQLRRTHPNLHRSKFFQESVSHNTGVKDTIWYRTDGQKMTDQEWSCNWVRGVAMMLDGETLDAVDALGQPLTDDTYLILLNSHHEPVTYALPASPKNGSWELILDTNKVSNAIVSAEVSGDFSVAGRSLVLLRELPPRTDLSLVEIVEDRSALMQEVLSATENGNTATVPALSSDAHLVTEAETASAATDRRS